MRKYIILLLITGTVLAQNGLDTLVLKNGTKYHGEFLRTDSKYDKYIPMVYFGPKNEESLRIVPVLGVERLQLKDGIFVINDGKINYNFDITYFYWNLNELVGWSCSSLFGW